MGGSLPFPAWPLPLLRWQPSNPAAQLTLQAAVGNASLHSPLAHALLGTPAQQAAAAAAAPQMDYSEAVALASACLLAAEGARGASMQVGWCVGVWVGVAAHSL